MRRENHVTAVVVVLSVMVCAAATVMAVVRGNKMQGAAARQQQLEQTIRDLQDQVHRAKAQENSAARQITQLEDALVLLTEKRHQDQQVIKDIWALLGAGCAT